MQRFSGPQAPPKHVNRPHTPQPAPGALRTIPLTPMPKAQRPAPVPAAPQPVFAPAGAPKQLLTLRRHVLALVPEIVGLVLLIGLFVVVASMLRASALVILGGILVGLATIGYRILEWRTFTITIKYDRIKVRHNFLLFERDVTYPLPGFQGVTVEQGLLGRICNTGTLVLAVRGEIHRFTLLAPFSTVNATLGW